MPRILDVHPPLQQICKNASIEPEQVAAAIKDVTGENITPQGVLAMLRRGTRNVDYLQALVNVTGLPMSVISEAGKPQKYIIAKCS